LLKNQLFSS